MNAASDSLDERGFEVQSRRVLEALGAAEQRVHAEQYVHVSSSAIDAPGIVGYRRNEQDPFTGWEIIATTEDVESATFGYYSVRELSAKRPEWLIALPLPAGWSFRFVGKTLIDCVSPDGETHPMNIFVEASGR
jgi:hypothetical protein